MMDGCPHLDKEVELECDGKKISLPENIEGIMIINIPSYAGGTNMWGIHQDSPISVNDKKLEIVAVKGSFHVGECKVGASKGLRICQASTVVLTFLTANPIYSQVDGEPWLQSKTKIQISHLNQAKVLSRKQDILIVP